MRRVAVHLFTGADNKTHDLGRYAWAISLAAIIAAAAWNASHEGKVNLLEFSEALGIATAAAGGAIWAKAKTEPRPCDKEETEEEEKK